MVEWLIHIVLRLEVICQFSRHYKQCQFMRDFMNVHQFLIIEWIVLNVMENDEKWLRSCEEFDSLSENQLISFNQQAICN